MSNTPYCRCSAVAFFLLFFAFSAKSTTWYVATNGNDNNAGTLVSPLQTIPEAIDRAEPGDEIQLRGGTYPSNEIRIGKNNLTIRSYPGEWAIISAVLNVEDVASCFWYNEPDVTGGLLENLEITGGFYYGVSFETNWDWGGPPGERRGASNITIRGCKIHDTGRDCIKIKPGCANIHILSCELYNSGVGPSNDPNGTNAEGIDNVNGSGMIVRNTFIHHTSTSGVYAKGGARNCIIEENLIMNVGESGILLGFYTDGEFFDAINNPNYYECLDGIARNNIVVNTGGAGIGLFASSGCQAYHNTVVTAASKFYAPLFFAPGEIYFDETNFVTPPNVNSQVFNNIFVDLGPVAEENNVVQIRPDAFSGPQAIQHNLYWKMTGAATYDDGVNYPPDTFSAWKTVTGFDANSLEINPQLNAQYHLNSSSPAIGAAQVAGAALRDYDGKNRSGSLDIGADQFNAGPALVVPPPAGVVGTGISGTTGVGALLSTISGLEVFPNPAPDGIFWLKMKTAEPLTLTVFDLQGQTKLTQKMTNATQRLDLNALPAGIYLLQVQSATGWSVVPLVKSATER